MTPDRAWDRAWAEACPELLPDYVARWGDEITNETTDDE